MDPVSEPSAGVAFGRFQVLPDRRELLADGRPVRLGGRAFDVLIALIEARGATVSKDALMARVWPGRIVEENNLQAQVSALRAAFGADRELIRTVSGRGYQFAGEIRALPAAPVERAAPAATVTWPEATLRLTNVPEPVSDLIGRDDELREVLTLVAAHRLVTLTGPGGIGKTSLALAAARRLLPRFADGVWLAELAPLADAGLIPATVAAAASLELAPGPVSAAHVASALRGKELLVILDNCEHVIDAAALMAEALLHANAAAHVIATSREPLKAEGECICTVPPLTVPAEDTEDHLALLGYDVIRLFLERARAAAPHFAPDRGVTRTIAAICRRLDGIPLAIELAAARAAAIGTREVAARLDDRFALLTSGRRTALPRHQTLRATLDWSYNLLPEPEQSLLRQLAVFVGGVPVEGAVAVMRGAGYSEASATESLANLVEKSLAVRDQSAPAGRLQLLETIRAYALEKLVERGEAEHASRRHAEFFSGLFGSAGAVSQLRPSTENMARFEREIDNIRAALHWSFSPAGHAETGVILTAHCALLWLHSTLLSECADRAERALQPMTAGMQLGDALRMQLHLALGVSLGLTMGDVDRTKAALVQAIELGERLDDRQVQLRGLWALWALHINIGQARAAQTVVEQFSSVAGRADDRAALLVADRLRGYTLHHLGENHAAQACCERVLRFYRAATDRNYVLVRTLDQHTMAHAMLARVLWYEGCLDQAAEHVRASLEEAQSNAYRLSICEVLRVAGCPVALMAGDLSAAEQAIAMLRHIADSTNAAFYKIPARLLQGKFLIARGEFAQGVALLRSELDSVETPIWALMHPEFLGALAEGLAGFERLGEALATLIRH
jgi:predicted ATPase/DNA-binding winged helix-turn-helix (wHTH) protein